KDASWRVELGECRHLRMPQLQWREVSWIKNDARAVVAVPVVVRNPPLADIFMPDTGARIRSQDRVATHRQMHPLGESAGEHKVLPGVMIESENKRAPQADPV